MAGDDKTEPTGISAAALNGARQGEQEQVDQNGNAEVMARPAPGNTDSRTDGTASSPTESTAHLSEFANDQQAADDDDAQWRRAGGGGGGGGNPDDPGDAGGGKPDRG